MSWGYRFYDFEAFLRTYPEASPSRQSDHADRRRWHPLLPKDDDALVRELVRSFLAYLGAEMTANSVSSRRGGYS
jgi:hypothetical protein